MAHNPVHHRAAPSGDRNLMLDFFRGLALLIIFVNHMPNNLWSGYTPSRYGFSDSAEIFVFISGFVAAMVYSASFRKVGIMLASARVLRRCASIYAAHIGMFLIIAFICVVANEWQDKINYISRLNIQYFFNQTPRALLGFATLHYVPNYFDILPMYLVLMLWIPLVMMLAQYHRGLVVLFCGGLYAAMLWGNISFAAEPFSDRPWFFNPFAWQLMFFIGFAFGAGWVRLPPAGHRVNRWLMAAAVSYLIACVPFCWDRAWIQTMSPDLKPIIMPMIDKTGLGVVRIVHFLSLAFVVRQIAQVLPMLFHTRLARAIASLGQNALANFVLSMTLSQIGGMVLDQLGYDFWGHAVANIGGIIMMFALHYAGLWVAGQPWKNAPHQVTLSGWGTLVQPGLRLAFLLVLTLLPFFALEQTRQHNMLSFLQSAPSVDDILNGSFGDNEPSQCLDAVDGACEYGDINLDRL